MKEALENRGVQKITFSAGIYFDIVGIAPEWYISLFKGELLKRNKLFILSVTTILLQKYERFVYEKRLYGRVDDDLKWVDKVGLPIKVATCEDSRAVIFKDHGGFAVSNVLDIRSNQKVQLTGKPCNGGKSDLVITRYSRGIDWN